MKSPFFSDGTRLVDGKNISDKALEKKLSELQKKKGEVHYYTDKKMSKKSVMKNLALFKLFGKYKLRVISYKDKNFSKIGS